MSQPLVDLPSRLGHSCLFNKDKVYLFGGTLPNSKTFLDDLIEINENQEWKIHANSKVNSPGPRIHHSTCLRKCKNRDDDEMILFGGKSKNKEFHNKVWSFKLNNNGNGWSCLSLGDKIISPRFGHSGAVFGDYLFVFGGMDEKNVYSHELFAFNLVSQQWKLVEMSVSIPGRCHHASVLDEESGDWYLFGGRSSKSVLNDFVRIKLSTYDEGSAKCESEVLISNLSEEFSRFGHSIVLESVENSRKFYSIGGCNLKKDFLDCISLDLDQISNGWKVETEHTLSKTFESFSQEVGPVFHVTTPIKITTDNETILTYFVFGGTYENTKIPKAKETKKKQVEKEPTEIFDIFRFDNELNDDIFRLVLSFLTVSDLMKIELVCKKLRIFNLTTDDQLWETYYHDRIKWFKEASKTTQLELNTATGQFDPVLVSSNIFDSYQKYNNNFKRRLIDLVGDLVKEAEKHTQERVKLIENLPQPKKDVFLGKDELMKHSLYNYGATSIDIKVVFVGASAIGKTQLYQVVMGNPIDNNYIPTVFDNYSLQCHSDEQNFNLGLWDTAGQPEFDRLRPLSYPQTDIFLIGFSCVSDISLNEIITKWKKEVDTFSTDVPLILVCTKVDLRDDPVMSRKLLIQDLRKPISYMEGELLARKLGCYAYLETSAQTKIGTKEFCELIIRTVDSHRGGGKINKTKKKCLVQ